MAVQTVVLHELSRAGFHLSNRNGCELVNYPVKRFKFQHPRTSENLIVAEARVAAEPEPRGPIDGQSLHLLLSAFYQNFIYRPLRNLSNFFIVTKSILYDPNTRVEEKYLVP